MGQSAFGIGQLTVDVLGLWLTAPAQGLRARALALHLLGFRSPWRGRYRRAGSAEMWRLIAVDREADEEEMSK